MKDKITAFFNKNLSLVLPAALASVLSSAIFAVYGISVFSAWSVLITVLCLSVFKFCDYCVGLGSRGKLYITLFVVADVMLFLRMISGSSRQAFMEWFFTASVSAGFRIGFLLTLLVFFPVFFGMTIYYFTRVLYRMGYLVLLSLIPCIVYVKVVAEINNFYLVLIAMLNMAICIQHIYEARGGGARIVGLRSYILSSVCFMFVIMLIASAVPKKNEAKYFSSFQRLFMNINTSLELGENYSELNDTSGNADNYEDFSNRRMYTVYGSNIPYLKRQNFDYYDFEEDRWYPYEKDPQLYPAELWKSEHFMLNMTALQSAIKHADMYEPGFSAKYGLENIANGSVIHDPVNNMYIQSHNFGAVYYLAPERTLEILLRNNSDPIYVTSTGCFRNRKNKHPLNTMYQVTYYNEFVSRQSWIAGGGANFSAERSMDMLTELRDILRDNDDEFYWTSFLFLQELKDAEYYRSIYADNNKKISDEVKNLAIEITQGCTYDWQKAEALQKYFADSGFIYDLEYTAKDTSPEYFLFKSHRGTCSDFASAYVLMARSLGMNVRYAEGFTAEETGRVGVYAIMDSNAHAYPEVFIPNMGWIVYEPTVASAYNGFAKRRGNLWFDLMALDMDYKLMLAVTFAAFIIFAAAFIYLVVIPFADEKLFVRRIRRASPAAAVKMLYGRIAQKTVKGLIPDAPVLTPYELAQRIAAVMGCEIYSLVFKAEKVIYGGGNANDADKADATESYFKLKDAIKEYKKSSRRKNRTGGKPASQ